MRQRLALAWFPQAGFAEFRAAQADAERIPLRWEEWRERIEKQLQARGLSLAACQRVDLDLDQLRTFCAARGLRMDSTGRSTFAAAMAMAQVRDDGDRDH